MNFLLFVLRSSLFLRIQDHGEQRVIAAGRNGVDGALLAQSNLGAIVKAAKHRAIAMQGNAKVMDRLLLMIETVRRFALPYRIEHGLRDARLERYRGMHVPLLLLPPVRGRDQDGELAQSRRKGAAKTQVLAERADARHQFGTVEEWDEWPEWLDAAELSKLLRGACLVRRHAVAGGTPFLSRSSIAATNVSISSSGV